MKSPIILCMGKTWGIVCLSFFLSSSLHARSTSNKDVCPVPKKGANIGGFVIACDYKNTVLEQDYELLKQGKRVGVPPLRGTASDVAFYKFLGNNLSLEMPNLCEGSKGKSDILVRLRKMMNEGLQYLVIGLSAHGGYVPYFKNGKFQGLRWAMLTGGTFMYRHCMDFWQNTQDQIEKKGVESVEKEMAKQGTAAKKFSETCSEHFLTYDEIQKEVGERQALVIADSCFSGGICHKRNPATQIVAMSAKANKLSYEENQIAASEQEPLEKAAQKEFDKRRDLSRPIVTEFFESYFKKHPEIKDPNARFPELLGEIRKEVAESPKAESETFEKLLADVYPTEEERKSVRTNMRVFTHGEEELEKEMGRLFKQPEHFMGNLNSHLYDRDFTKLDVNNDKQLSIAEFVADLKKPTDKTDFPPLAIGKGCTEAWQNFPLIQLKDGAIPRPPQLKSFQHGEEKLLMPSSESDENF